MCKASESFQWRWYSVEGQCVMQRKGSCSSCSTPRRCPRLPGLTGRASKPPGPCPPCLWSSRTPRSWRLCDLPKQVYKKVRGKGGLEPRLSISFFPSPPGHVDSPWNNVTSRWSTHSLQSDCWGLSPGSWTLFATIQFYLLKRGRQYWSVKEMAYVMHPAFTLVNICGNDGSGENLCKGLLSRPGVRFLV